MPRAGQKKVSSVRRLFDDLPLRPTLAAVLTIGLALPVLLVIWTGLQDRRRALLEDLEQDHQRIVDTLANGMQTPIWEVRPDTARPMLDAAMLDTRIVSVRVFSPLMPDFLSLTLPGRQTGASAVLEAPVLRRGEEIGTVRVEMSQGWIDAEVGHHRAETALTAAVQLAIGLVLLIATVGTKVAVPLRRLVEQAGAFAAGRLDQPVDWARRDEIGVLGRRLEEMRRSLRGLIGDLERRNADLRSREEEMGRQAAVLAATLDNMTDGITLVDGERRILAWNRRFIEMFHLPPGFLAVGMPMAEVHRLDMERGRWSTVDRDATFRALQDSYDPARPSTVRLDMADGQVINLRRRPLPGDAGGYVSTYTDVTAEVAAERRQRETLGLLEAVMDAVPAVLHVKDRDLRYRMVNRRLLEVWGGAREAIIGRTDAEAFPAARPEAGRDRDRQVLETGRAFPFSETLSGPYSALPREVLATKVPLEDGAGNVTHIVTVELDITDRKLAERALRESEEMYRQLVDLAPFGIMLYDESGVTYLNRAGCAILEAPSAAAVAGQDYLDFVAPGDREAAGARRRQVLEAGESIAFMVRRMLTARGRTVEVQIAGVPIERGGRRTALVMFNDVTESRRLERALGESERNFRTITETHPVPVAIFATDDMRILYASPGFAAMVGAAPDALLEASFERYCADPAGEARLARLMASGTLDTEESLLRREDGSLVPIDCGARLITYHGRQAVLASIVDLSEQKRAAAELQRHREALHQAEKMSALGALLAGVAHELNNPLAVVVGRAIMLEDSVTDPAVLSAVGKIREAADRCARIVKAFLAMARQQAPTRVAVRMREVIDSSLDLVAYGLSGSNVAVTVEAPSDLPEIMADAGQLNQVLTNLLLNAQHALSAIDGPRRIAIAARADHGAGMLQLSVADNGPGMPEDVRPRVFDPFFTTKPAGQGTGIGLSVSAGIVESHGGTIRAMATPGGGATFVVRLPLRTGAAPVAEVAAEPPAAAGTRILIVEDEAEIAAMLADILARDGHRVEIAGNGRRALERLSQGPFDLILSDLVMPDLDGPGLYERLRAEHPALARRTAFITGDALGSTAHGFLERACRPVIEKPFVPADVRRIVRDLLATPPANPA